MNQATSETHLGKFLNSVEAKFPEASSRETGTVSKAYPAALRKWVEANGGICKFSFSLELPSGEMVGGMSIGEPKELQENVKGWIDDTWIAEDEVELEKWSKAVAFAALENGDFLAFEKKTKEDAPIIYLSHDDESKVIAPSFEHFIREWAALGYVGPELWVLEPFLDEEGFLDRKAGDGPEHRENLLKAGLKV
jgi:hypothetical protein